MGVNMTQTASDPRSTGSWVISTPLDRPIRGIARRVGGTKAKEVERFLKFAIVGVIGAIVDFGTLNLLLHTILPAADSQGNTLGLNVAIATTIAFAAAVASNFMWNRIWTYPDARGRSLRRQLGLFTFISLVGWLARLIWINTSFSMFADLIMANNTSMDHHQAAIVGTNIAQLIAVGVVMIWNFVANRLWTYNDVQ
jgi:putative flippase GtrA